MSSFTDDLIVKHLDGNRWELMREFSYYISDKDKGQIILVPKGFTTDFASIPRLFWTLIGHPTGKYGKAAIIHDYLYHIQTKTRSQTDRIFYEAMRVLKVSFIKRWLMYHYVKTLGWIPWGMHKRRNRRRHER